MSPGRSRVDVPQQIPDGHGVIEASRPLALDARNLTKSYPGVQALSGVSVQVRRGEVVGMVGENGAGKSTFLAIVNGTIKPDRGSVAIAGRELTLGSTASAGACGVATVHQEQALIPTLRVYENMFLGRSSRFTRFGIPNQKALLDAATRTLRMLEIDIDPRVSTGSLSFGQRQLIEIAKAFALTEVDDVRPILLLDEPTSGLSEEETGHLLQNIREWRERASFVFVSHQLDHVFAVCDKVVALRDGAVVMEASAQSASEGSLHKAIVGRERDTEYYKETRQRRSGTKLVLRARKIGRQRAFRNVSLEVHEGEIVGLAGIAGCGKAEILRSIVGVDPFDEGTVSLFQQPLRPGHLRQAIRRGAAYVPAERHAEGVILGTSVAANLSLPLLREFKLGPGPLLSTSKEVALVDSWIERLGIKTIGGDTLISNLSGGNQQKVVFARWLARGTGFFALDDPTRGLDVGAREELYVLIRDLADAGTGFLLVSDSLPELIGLSNRILIIKDGEVRAEVAAPSPGKPAEVDIVKHMV